MLLPDTAAILSGHNLDVSSISLKDSTERRDSNDSATTLHDGTSLIKEPILRSTPTSPGNEAFWQVAEDHLVPLKAPWLNFIPVKAEGTVLWVGQLVVLDITSGSLTA